MWMALHPTLACHKHTIKMERSIDTICALYCRLSKEDENKRDESESITNQKAILTSFAQQHGWTIYKTYVDEDRSGADGRRPGFLAMLEDAANGRFGILLCKSQSRFTRDMEAVEKYIHGSFKQWGIRFVTVIDGADTENHGNKKARQINGLVNEWYLEDLSENVRTVLDCKRACGQYIGSFALYGYQKDPSDHGKLKIDPAAAAIVRRIYALYLSGESTRSIAARLNLDGIAAPSQYKAEFYPTYPQVGSSWNKNAVSRILKNEIYTGMMVQGRQRKVSYKSKQRVNIPETDWLRVSGTHEAIIPRYQFDAVQQQLRRRTRQVNETKRDILSGLVYCGSCGSSMVHTSGGKNGQRHYLRCAAHSADPKSCTRHSIDADALVERIAQCVTDHTTGYASSVPHFQTSKTLNTLQALRAGLIKAGIDGPVLAELDAHIAAEIAARNTMSTQNMNTLPFSRALALTLIRRIFVDERDGETQRIRIDYNF
jgi:site-specific DNA recombinase